MIEKHRNESLESDAKLLEGISKNSEEIKKSVEKCEEVSEKLKVQQATIESTINSFKENSTKALEANKEEVKDLTKTLMIQMENERLQFKLAEAKHIIEKLSMESELKTLKQEVGEQKSEILELKTELKENKENLEILQKKFDDFKRELMEESRA